MNIVITLTGVDLSYDLDLEIAAVLQQKAVQIEKMGIVSLGCLDSAGQPNGRTEPLVCYGNRLVGYITADTRSLCELGQCDHQSCAKERVATKRAARLALAHTPPECHDGHEVH